MLNSMIILFHLKLDKFYYIGDMNWLKMMLLSGFYQNFDLSLCSTMLARI